jgi:hypothetical protein
MEMAKRQYGLNRKAKEILKRAQERGIEHSYMFTNIFTQYEELLRHLDELEKNIQADGVMTQRINVKGVSNTQVNPAITAYNQTAATADKTAGTLLKFVGPPPTGAEASDDAFDLF